MTSLVDYHGTMMSMEEKDLREEIAQTRVDLGFARTDFTIAVYRRILAREEADLERLKEK